MPYFTPTLTNSPESTTQSIPQATDDNQQPNIQCSEEEEEMEEEDPLDAFMSEIKQLQDQKPTGQPTSKRPRHRFDQDDDPSTHPNKRRLSKAPTRVDNSNYDNFEEEEEEECPPNKRDIQPLGSIDHSQVHYAPTHKNFYTAHPDIIAMTDAEVDDYRRHQNIHIFSSSLVEIPRPVISFEQCGFDTKLLSTITQKAGYTHPTPIQAQAIPVALSGYDILGMAQTGSGKTVAFVLPLVVHCLHQQKTQPVKRTEAIAVVVTPTRELSEQIHKETRRFASRVYGFKACAAWGGLDKSVQIKEMKGGGAEIVVGTPGRLIDLVRSKALTLSRVTFLVLDEADRMFDMGFEPQVRSIMNQLRPDRQSVMFSATMPRKIEQLAIEVLNSPIKIIIGGGGGGGHGGKQHQQAHSSATPTNGILNPNITQHALVFSSDQAKMTWLLEHISSFIDQGEVLIFVNHKYKVDELSTQLRESAGARVSGLHGDMSQATRMAVLNAFRHQDNITTNTTTTTSNNNNDGAIIHVVVATDIAARGLDIRGVKTVIQYDAAKDRDTHVHRVGRTGRGGDRDGVAWTLLTGSQVRQAVDVVECLMMDGGNSVEMVHREVWDLAMKDGKFRNKYGGRREGYGGGGGGPFSSSKQQHGPRKKIGFVAASKGNDSREVAVNINEDDNNNNDNNSSCIEIFLQKQPGSSNSIVHCHDDHRQHRAPPPPPPPPPVPVTERPLYMLQRRRQQQQQQHQQQQNNNKTGDGGRDNTTTTNNNNNNNNTAAVQEAIARAQAIAARLTGQQPQQHPPSS